MFYWSRETPDGWKVTAAQTVVTGIGLHYHNGFLTHVTDELGQVTHWRGKGPELVWNPKPYYHRYRIRRRNHAQ